MSRRIWAATVASAVVHIVLVLFLRKGSHPLVQDPPAAVELEVVYSPSITPRAATPELKEVPQALPAPGRPPRAAIGVRGTSAVPASEPATIETAPAVRGEAIDRLWTLRAAPRVPMVGPPVGDEDPNEMFANRIPNVIKRSPGPKDAKVIEGRSGVKMKLADDGSIESFVDPSAHIAGAGIVFDVTDSVMKKLGENPYRYEQHRLAEATREERLCRRLKVQAENERQALFSLTGELAAIWGNTALSTAERRKLLFARWDECREDKGDAGASGAGAMRAAILSFIRMNLPYGSAHAYSAHELAAFNAERLSAAAFAPYTPPASLAPVPDAGGG